MDAIVTIYLPKLWEKPKEYSALIFSDERALRSLLLGILANDTDFPPNSEIWCSADEKGATRPTLESLLGSAIYMKNREKKLEVHMATGPFEGLLERLLPPQVVDLKRKEEKHD